MVPLQDPAAASEAAAAVPEWFLYAVPLLGLTLLLLLGVGVIGVWALLSQLRRTEQHLARLDRLDSIGSSLESLVDERDELGLRRLEHALLEIRDGQKKVEERLLLLVESQHSPNLELHPAGPRSGSLGDRVINRLLAMGYERVRLLTPAEELGEVAETGGEVLVEARRHGALCKGRVLVREGTLVDVQIKSGYAIFP